MQTWGYIATDHDAKQYWIMLYEIKGSHSSH